MSGPSIVVLEDSPRSGLENMEIDTQLLLGASDGSFLRSIGAGCGLAPLVVRFYYWSEPTLSLGNFQSIQQLSESTDTQGHEGLGRLAWVQRKTGGGAILHDREITYSIVVPSGNSTIELASKGHSERLYRSVHESVVDGLRQMGIQAGLSESCTCSAAKIGKLGEPFLCFHRRTPVDVLVGEHKVLGSAQRRGKSGLLQHGSLLLAHSAAYPSLSGISDLAELPERYQFVGGGPNQDCFGAWQEWLEHRIFQAIQGLIGPLGEVLRLNLGGRSVRI